MKRKMKMVMAGILIVVIFMCGCVDNGSDAVNKKTDTSVETKGYFISGDTGIVRTELPRTDMQGNVYRTVIYVPAPSEFSNDDLIFLIEERGDVLGSGVDKFSEHVLSGRNIEARREACQIAVETATFYYVYDSAIVSEEMEPIKTAYMNMLREVNEGVHCYLESGGDNETLLYEATAHFLTAIAYMETVWDMLEEIEEKKEK